MGHKTGHLKQQKKAPNPPLVPAPVIKGNEQTAPNADTGKASKEQQIAQTPTAEPPSWDKWTCRATVAIAIANITYAVIAIWQLTVMSGQLEQMRIGSRAWISFRGGTCTPVVDGKKLQMELTFHNSGETPANKVTVGSHLIVEKVKKGEEERFDIESYTAMYKDRIVVDIGADTTFAPGMSVIAPYSTDFEVSGGAAGQIKDSTLIVGVFGEIVYNDIFGQKHTTLYCAILDPSTWKLRTTKQYNRME